MVYQGGTGVVKIGRKAEFFDDPIYLWYNKNVCLVDISDCHVDAFVYCSAVAWHDTAIDKLLDTIEIKRKRRIPLRKLDSALHKPVKRYL